jgi:hypothetical protein
MAAVNAIALTAKPTEALLARSLASTGVSEQILWPYAWARTPDHSGVLLELRAHRFFIGFH